MNKLINYALTTCIILSSCNKDELTDNNVQESTKYYIQTYVDATEMDIHQNSDSQNKKPSLYITLNGIQYDYKGSCGLNNYKKKHNVEEYIFEKMGALPSAYISSDDSTNIISVNQKEIDLEVSDNLNKFLSIASQNKDTTWNGKLAIPFANKARNDSIFSIEIITEKDYDIQHKAGDDLSDIVKFYGSTPYNYIQNGYKPTKDRLYSQEMEDSGISYYSYELIECYCNEIQNVETKYFDTHFDLLFTTKPTNNGKYPLTINIKLSKGTISKQTEIEF